MKHEASPRDFDLEMAIGAGAGFAVLVAGLLIALLFYLRYC